GLVVDAGARGRRPSSGGRVRTEAVPETTVVVSDVDAQRGRDAEVPDLVGGRDGDAGPTLSDVVGARSELAALAVQSGRNGVDRVAGPGAVGVHDEGERLVVEDVGAGRFRIDERQRRKLEPGGAVSIVLYPCSQIEALRDHLGVVRHVDVEVVVAQRIELPGA